MLMQNVTGSVNKMILYISPRYHNVNLITVQFDSQYQQPGESSTMSRISCTSRITILRSYPVCTAFRFRMRNAITHVILNIDCSIKLIPSSSGARFVCKVSAATRDTLLSSSITICIRLKMQNVQGSSSGARWKFHIAKNILQLNL